MLKFLKESREELRKVVWPGRDEVFSSTVVVLVSTIIVSIFLFSVDHVFEGLFDVLISLGTRGR